MNRYRLLIMLVAVLLVAACSLAKQPLVESTDASLEYFAITDTLAAWLNDNMLEPEEYNHIRPHVRKGDSTTIPFVVTQISGNSPNSAPLVRTFQDQHVYQFNHLNNSLSFNHILIPSGGTYHIFSHINCTDRGDSIRDVKEFLRSMETYKDSSSIFDRLAQYREYGRYPARVDLPRTLDCDCAPCTFPNSISLASYMLGGTVKMINQDP